MKVLTLIICLFCAVAFGQEKPKTDTLALLRQWQNEMAIYHPVYIIVAQGKKLTYIKGFQKVDGSLYDNKKMPLRDKIIFSVLKR